MIKKIFSWLFKDFLYQLYDLAERKFTLHIEVLEGIPRGFPAVGFDGVVGVPYSSFLYLVRRVPSNLDPPASYYPFQYVETPNPEGIPTGLAFSSASPLPGFDPPGPYNNLPNVASLGINQIQLVGTPTVAGIFNFSITWSNSDIVEPQTALIRDYRVTIYANAGLLPSPQEEICQDFVCNVPSKKKGGGIGGYPFFCLQAQWNPQTQRFNICPKIVTRNGWSYYRTSVDARGICCYQIMNKKRK